MIAANAELLERDLIKLQNLAGEFADVLRQRGIEADIAQLAAQVGIQIFVTAYGHWLKTDETAGLPALCEIVMSRLATIVTIAKL